MAKKKRYKDIKHPDKFHEGLSAAWAKAEPYVLPAGIAVLVLLVAAGVWVTVARYWTARRDAPWIEMFRIERQADEAAARAQSEPDHRQALEHTLEELAQLVRDYPRSPAAAMALVRLSEGHGQLGHQDRGREPAASKTHFRRAAEAAEQFLADHPTHGLQALAAYNAGRARLELGEAQRAAPHFERAQTSALRFLAALAQLHAARCYEQMGRADSARRAYEALRNDPWADWCAQQAAWRLAQLERHRAPGS